MAVDDLSGVKGKIMFPIYPVLLYGLLRFLSNAGNDIRSSIFMKVQLEASREAALDTFKHLTELSLRFHLQRKTGTILRAIERGSSSINSILSFLLFNIIPTLLELTFVCIILLSNYKAWFALIIVSVIGIYVTFTLAITEWRIKYRRSMNNHNNVANNKAVDALLNIETVKYFTNERHEYKRYDEAWNLYIEASVKSQNSLALLNIGQTAIITLGVTGIMLLAGKYASSSPPSMTVGDFVMVNTYLLQLYVPLGFLGTSYRMIKTSLVDLENMFSLLKEEIDIKDAPGAYKLEVKNGDIQFSDVSFSYGDRPILKKVSFEIPSGHMVAIVGPTGSGKSTIARLLFRFYDVDSGLITIDGQNISRIKKRSLRKNIGVVPQDTVLFNESIEYNIRYGRIDATQEEIEKSAEIAHIHDFIMSLPAGYNTPVGERGLRLSGGEKQRVSISRALLKDPKIMIFDEATSSLDTKTEKDIQSSLLRASKGRTTLVIAHRLSTIVDADMILVLKDGEIIEKGTQQELLQLGGEYADMWLQQLQENHSKTEDPNPLINL
eukprot:TRINITY_DN7363_c0_g1_i1.p1 TRINITY_DN7363_c0_g1~~TRINITY_DN7363_c0_g1_i1.p1  ORF type:complete len:616 (-),score=88.59 TRINITY_DN7363_c0_g1_i1:3-1655(-)